MSEIVAWRYRWQHDMKWVHSSEEPEAYPNRIVEPLCKSSSLDEEREVIANEARRYASYYPEGSDGRNTFMTFAEDFVERRRGRS
jgi:hypothetical protein